MTEFTRDFISSIEGTSLEISTKELCGGARIYYIFNDVFGHALQSIDPTTNLTLQDIRTAIRNSTGPRPSLFVPEVAFDLLVKPQIKLLEPPSLRCVELVYEELMKICHNCTSPELQRFPRLGSQLVEVVSELLRERLGPTSEYVSSLIGIQAAYINTNHPDFVAGSAAIARAGAPQPAPRVPSVHGSQVEEDDESSSDDTGSQPNGLIPPHVQHNRSASASVPDIRRPAVPKNEKRRQHHRTASGSQPQPAIPSSLHPTPLPAGGTSPHTAKETFLNYFFGGPNGTQEGPTHTSSAPGSRAGTERRMVKPPPSAFNREKELLPDLGTRRTGRASLDAPQAYDMKSLGKHLDAVRREGDSSLMAERKRSTAAYSKGGDGNDPDSKSYRELLWHHPADDSRSRSKGHHASFGESIRDKN